MDSRFTPIRFSLVRRAAAGKALALLSCFVFLPFRLVAAPRVEPAAKAAELPGTRATTIQSGTIQTTDGLTLRLTTDLGSVKILQSEAGADSAVRYSVRIETDAHGPAAQQLLDNYSLKARTLNSGVEITGILPAQAVSACHPQIHKQKRKQ